MPENLVIGLFVFGAVLILFSLLGGRFKIFSVAVSSNISSPFIRIIAFVLGMLAKASELAYHSLGRPGG